MMAMQKKMIMVFRETQQNSESSTVEANSNRSALTPLLPPSSMLGAVSLPRSSQDKANTGDGGTGGRHHNKKKDRSCLTEVWLHCAVCSRQARPLDVRR